MDKQTMSAKEQMFSDSKKELRYNKQKNHETFHCIYYVYIFGPFVS